MQIFRKRFNFKLINRFLQNKTKSFLMDNTGFDSWVQPCKKPDSYITGLQVINSLYPSKLVSFIIFMSEKLIKRIFNRSSLFQLMENKLPGICVDPLYMIIHIWDMLELI